MSNDNKLPIPDLSDMELIRLWAAIANGESVASVDTIIRFARSIEHGVASHCAHIAAIPAEKPAAAAERGALVVANLDYAAIRTSTDDGKFRIICGFPNKEVMHAAFEELMALLATPPAQAAEPAQVDEVVGIAETIRSELERLRNFTPPVSGLWDELYANVDARIDELVAALTQRPAAPLATDAGVERDAARYRFLRDHCVVEDGNGWLQVEFQTARFGQRHPAPGRTQWIDGDIDAALAAHPAAERTAQGEAGPTLKDNEIAAIVNHVTAIAKAYGQTQQCREWMSQYLVPILKGQK